MAYSTQADLLNRMSEPELIQLTDDAGTGSLDSGKLDAAITAADATIDAYAGGRYTLPLTVSEQVRNLSVDLAIYELESRRRRVREVTQQRREQAIRFLEKVAAGRVQLEQPSAPQGVEAGVKAPDREADPRVFEDEHLENY